MSDIFKMIRGMSNTEREPRRKNSLNDKLEELNKEDLDLDIGEVKMSNPNLVEFETINFKELNELPDKKKVTILTKEYLSLVDRFHSLDTKINKLSKDLSSSGIDLHQQKKENDSLKDLIRDIGKIIPEGIDLKRQLEELNWNPDDIKPLLISKIQETIDRALRANEYVEEKMSSVLNENAQLKKLIIYTENEKNKTNQKYEALVNKLNSTDDSSLNVHDMITEINNTPFEPIQSPVEDTSNQIKDNSPTKNEEKISSTEVSTSKEKTNSLLDDFDNEGEVVEVDTHILLDVEKHLGYFNDQKKYVLEVMGKTGICRNQDLREFLEKDERGKELFQKGSKFLYQDMTTVVKGLKDSGYLNATKVELGSKGGYNFPVFELSELGSSIFKVLTKRNPKEPEFKSIMAQHKTLEHGYLIKESANEFKAKGYTVYENREDLRFDLPNGKRKDFDLIIEKNNEKFFIEVERGTHTDEDFFNAMDKIYQVMTNLGYNPAPFHFISPNESLLLSKTKRQFFLWIKKRHGGFTEAKGKMIAHFTTFDKLKKPSDDIWEIKKI